MRITLVVTTIGLVLLLTSAVTFYSAKSAEAGGGMVKLVITSDLRKFGVETIASDDPAFAAELEKYAGHNPVIFSSIQAARPFVFLVKNNSKHEIVGMTLRWTKVAVYGKTWWEPQVLNYTGALIGLKPDASMVGYTALINPGEARAFSTVNIGEQGSGGAGSGRMTSGVGHGTPPTEEDFANPANFIARQVSELSGQLTSISVSIDGLFFDDGTFVGEDKSFYFDETRGMVKAQVDFRRRLAEAERSGESDTVTIDKFVESTPEQMKMTAQNLMMRYPRLPERYTNATEAFEQSYADEMSSLRTQLVTLRKHNRTDKMILDSFRRAKEEDFKTLRKLTIE